MYVINVHQDGERKASFYISNRDLFNYAMANLPNDDQYETISIVPEVKTLCTMRSELIHEMESAIEILYNESDGTKLG